MDNKQLPSLSDLHHSPEIAFKSDQLNLLLNQPPHASWVKKHPIVSNCKYLPIDKVEFLLTRIFQEWRLEVIDTKIMFNSIAVTVRLHYKNPVSGQWSFHDGVGAKSVQTDSGKSAADLGAIKDAAVMMALPSAKSFAIKDAAEHLGALFGRDLNRKDTVMFTGSYQEPPKKQDTIDRPHYEEPAKQINQDFEL